MFGISVIQVFFGAIAGAMCFNMNGSKRFPDVDEYIEHISIKKSYL
jgi:hypothetical protein